MKLLDPDHPFFDRPLARWLTTVTPILWSLVEFWSGAHYWGLAFLAVGAYAGYMLFTQRGKSGGSGGS